MMPKAPALALALALALAALGGAGCAPASRGMAPPPATAVRLTLPFVAQAGPYLCGLACLDMLTRCYGRPLGPETVRTLKAEAIATGGISGASMKSALEGAGYEVEAYPGTLDHGPAGLFRQVDRGLPVLVMTGSGLRHYCLVDGYDENLATVALLDPARGRVHLAFKDFEREWGLAGHFALLAAPD
jgi:ABC-type bacteriocin/lantibiotic exporter with double-glycine peptidase domain